MNGIKKTFRKIKGLETKKSISGLMGKPNYTHELGNPSQHVKPANRVMDSIGINNLFFFLNYCLFNYMITKINYCKYKRQTNTEIVFFLRR